jgi:hypothetical protein
MSGLALLTLIHVVISLLGIGTGLVVMAGLLRSARMDRWTAVFLASTLATSVTGFFFPVEHVLPSHIVGAISIVVLGVALIARYARNLVGGARAAYVIAASVALYLNVFVLVVQSFLKVSALHALAPTGSEPPFAVAQGIVLIIFIVLTVQAVRRFRPAPGRG